MAQGGQQRNSFEELSAELKSLKKRLYTFKLKGIELHQKARNHFCNHRCSGAQHEGDEENVEQGDPKSTGFGPLAQTSPLSNEYILEIIAGYLPLRDLKTCKNVCRLWAQEMTHCEMKRKSIVIADDEDYAQVSSLIEEKLNGNSVNIATVVLLSTSLANKNIQRLVYHFGDTLSSLRVDECGATSQELYSVLKQLPYLDHLSVKTYDAFPRRNVGGMQVSLLDQITSNSFSPGLVLPYLKELIWDDLNEITSTHSLPVMCPNLMSLRLSVLGRCQPSSFKDISWDSLRNLEVKLSKEKLPSQSDIFESLSTMKLKLKKLKLVNVGKGNYGRMKKLAQLLDSARHTLEVLSISGVNDPLTVGVVHDTSQLVPLPMDLPALKTLTIDKEFLPSLEVLNCLPLLEKFNCKCTYWINWWITVSKHPLPKVHPVMEEVTLGAIDGECLQKMANIFPHLNCLEISEDRIDDLAFRVICKSMKTLRSLRIKPSENRKHLSLTDAGITGLSQEDCRELLDKKDLTHQNIQSLRMHPFVGDLKELRILEINCARSLTDVSVSYGFAALPNIILINLPKCLVTAAGLNCMPNSSVTEESDGARRIRVAPTFGDNNSKALFNLVADNALGGGPLGLITDIVSDLNQISEGF